MTEQNPALEAFEWLIRNNPVPEQDQDTHEAVEAIRAALQSQAEPADKGEISDGYHTFNELYEHRHILFLHVLTTSGNKAWKSKLHHDGTMFDNCFIAGMQTDCGQVSYHLPIRMWGLFKAIPELERAPEWDGHTSDDVLVRIRDQAFNAHADTPITDAGIIKGQQLVICDLEAQIKELEADKGDDVEALQLEVIKATIPLPGPYNSLIRMDAVNETIDYLASRNLLKTNPRQSVPGGEK